MDLNWEAEETDKFVTNIGIISSNGKHGNNVMACEWTHHISYSPGLIAIHITPRKATYENIMETKEFGVSIASIEQAVLSSIAGNYSARNFDKIKALEELGFKFFKAKKINTLLVENASMNTECKLVNEIVLGDHVMLVGEIVALYSSDKKPIALGEGKYWELEKNLPKKTEEERARIRSVVEKYKK
ncbi:MAG: flavin reductase family protein [archaeon]|nr:flavin reductase family protein [archaeon]